MAQVALIAVLVEAIWESLKMVWQEGKLSTDRIGAIIVGVIVCIGVNIDLFNIVGLPFNYPVIGSVLSGVVISRGANFVHDLITKLEPNGSI